MRGIPERATLPRVPICDVCRDEYQRVAAFCPNCGAPLSFLAARLRDASRVVQLSESEIVVLADDPARTSDR
jgi:predicted amidophosphoribosyltransferase